MIEYLHSALYVLELAVGFGLVIFVHELGHFLAAKWVGIRVDRFSLGFGPRLVGFVRHGTDYRLSLIPLGGYVSMPGENPDDFNPDDTTHFLNRPPSQRLLVSLAGVFMNVVFAMILFTVALALGVPMGKALVGDVVFKGPAWNAGLRRGDKIVAVDGRRDIDFQDLVIAVAFTGPNQAVQITYQRDGMDHAVAVKPQVDKAQGMPTIGVVPPVSTTVGQVVKDAPAARAGLQAGDAVLAVDGHDLWDGAELEQYLRWREGQDVTLTIERDGKKLEKVVRPEAAKALNLGLEPAEPLTVGDVFGKPAEEAGLKQGDQILRVNGVVVTTGEQVAQIMALQPDRPLDYVVRRDGREFTVSIQGQATPFNLQPMIGIAWKPRDPIVGKVSPGSPLAQKDLQPGDRITKVNDLVISHWTDLELAAAQLAQKSKTDEVKITVSWTRAGQEEGADVTFQKESNPYAGQIGVLLEGAQTEVRRYPFYVAPWVGIRKTGSFAAQVYLTIRGIAERRVSASNAAGPVGILHMGYRTAEAGPTVLMYFLAIIGVNLAVINLLPIPVLDGGHVLLTIVEKIRGRKLGQFTMEVLTYAGLAFIILLFVAVTFNDIRRLFTMFTS